MGRRRRGRTRLMDDVYDIDDETREDLESVLELAQRIVDLQYDDASREGLQDLLTSVADRFGIACSELLVEIDEAGTITARFEQDEPTQPLKDTRPTLTAIDGGLAPGLTLVKDDDTV